MEKWTCRRDLIHIITGFIQREFLSLDDNGRCLLEIERSSIGEDRLDGEDCLGDDRGRFEEVRAGVLTLCGFSLIESEEESDENDRFASEDWLLNGSFSFSWV